MPDTMEQVISGVDEISDNATDRILSDSRLDLSFQCDPQGRSYLAKQYYTFPFHICRAQYMDKALPGMATMYMQSCSGGIFKGDRLSTTIHAAENTQVHVTTQASTIIHRMEADFAHQEIVISGENGALVEYLPDCTILFPEAKLKSSVDVTRHPNCDVILCDSFLAHNPNNTAETFSWFENELVIRNSDGQVDIIDRFRVTGEQFFDGEAAGSNPYMVHGTFALITSSKDIDELCATLRLCPAPSDEIYAGISDLPNNAGCWVRFLATDGVASKKYIQTLWSAAREALTGCAPTNRRK
ncbi:MAG: urease accessory protein UreD [Rhodospirillales bacterium]|jgi:urease accessory protein|nr:urease accessory protein UreD [Rhodospirillales bacterium]